MIVEDNEALAQTTGWMVEMLGHEYRVVLTPEAALAEIAAFQPNLMLVDIGLPGMNGYELCRRLKALPASENVTIVAQTGWGQEEHRRQSAEAGFDHHLVKPVQIEVLKTLIDELAARQR